MPKSSKRKRKQVYGNSKKNKKGVRNENLDELDEGDMRKVCELLLALADENDELVVEGESLILDRDKIKSYLSATKE